MIILSRDAQQQQVWESGKLVGFINVSSLFSEVKFLYGGANEEELFTKDDGKLAQKYIKYRLGLSKYGKLDPFYPFRNAFSEDLKVFNGVMYWEHRENSSGLYSAELDYEIIQTSVHTHFSGMIAETKLINDWLLDNRDKLSKFHKSLKEDVSYDEKVTRCDSFKRLILST